MDNNTIKVTQNINTDIDIVKNKALNMMLQIKSICDKDSLEKKAIDYLLNLMEVNN